MELVAKYDEREVYSFAGKISHLCSDKLKLPKPYFVCTFFLHETDWSKDELKRSIRRLINDGCVYLLFHGNRCEEAHECADETYYEMGLDTEMTDYNVIITTWHDNESEKNVIFETFCATWPAKDYEEKFRSYLVISLGTSEQNKYIRGLLENPELTIQEAVRGGN